MVGTPGWGHFYLYDKAGKLKNAVTSGDYRASRVVAVDAPNRLMYFHGNGHEPAESVYNEHLYCVHLDGTGMTLMDPGNGLAPVGPVAVASVPRR